ncbi:G2/mitotic-specific cyclin-A [Octopus bimaculoides]|uniref:Cyclin N-terminal domain-containing protein n=1 Tax=Octopus bimaculoides TaxID=37653 RepID=A0A0L8HP25_OCTBM|nr:G2/mitotic-specific cyclin-A [Octopus bimaculoides]|eukprot:XP_014770676.1 PREDICTED: G2/mitotic-specific cyclin-A-like [Octopus bimaculoides]
MSWKDVLHNLTGFYEREQRQKKVRNYLENQSFTAQDREAVIDWMIACVDHYVVSFEVFYLAVSYFDIYLSGRDIEPITSSKLQCLGASCLWISFTRLGQNQDKLANFLDMVSVTDRHSSEKDLYDMFSHIMTRFHYKTHLITPYNFLTSFFFILHLERKHNLRWMSRYILELAHYDADICVKNRYRPSLIATAALYTGLVALRVTVDWISDLSILTPYTGKEYEFRIVHRRMLKLLKVASPSKYRSAYTRYSRKEYNHVALVDFSFIY